MISVIIVDKVCIYSQFKERPQYRKKLSPTASFSVDACVFAFLSGGVICTSIVLNLVLLGDGSQRNVSSPVTILERNSCSANTNKFREFLACKVVQFSNHLDWILYLI